MKNKYEEEWLIFLYEFCIKHDDMNTLSEHATMKMIKDNPNIYWRSYYISKNKNLTMKMIKAQSSLICDWSHVSMNIDIKIIIDNYNFVSYNLNK